MAKQPAVDAAAFWSVFEAAIYFGVSERTVRRMCRDGELAHERVRGQIRIPIARDGFTPLQPRRAHQERQFPELVCSA